MRAILTAALALALFLPIFDSAAAPAKVGEKAPDFSLTDTDGKAHSLSELKGKYVVLEWTNFECPFVKKHYSSGNMQRTQEKLTSEGVVWLSVNSSAPGKQGYLEGEEGKEAVKESGTKATALLIDGDGKVGRSYGAKTTPHMFVIDPAGTLIYAGAIDDIPSTDVEDIGKAKNLVLSAIAEAKSGAKVSVAASEPYGCSVKYAS